MLRSSLLFAPVLTAALALTLAQDPGKTVAIELAGATPPPGGWRLVTRTVETRREGGRDYLAFVGEPDTIGMAWSPALAFADGEIEFDVRGRDIQGHSFVGIAFHIQDEATYDAVYLRPFNFRATDSARAAHSVQFVSAPGFPWDRLRAERTGWFEKAVPPALDPNGWIHVKVVSHGPWVDVFLDRSATPVLSVVNPSPLRSGGVGYFVHGTSVGDFRDLVIRPYAGPAWRPR